MKIGKMWFRTTNNAWYALVDGKQKMLAKGKDNEAMAQHEHAKLVMLANAVSVAGVEKNDQSPCEVIFASWLDDCKGKIKNTSFVRSAHFAKTFVEMHGEVSTRDMKRHHFQSWLLAHPKWNSSTQYSALGQMSACWNWAIKNEICSRNPVRGVDKPKSKARGENAIISEDEYLRILYVSRPYMRLILQGLMQTGCRPSEILSITAAGYKKDIKAWELEEHKTKEKVGIKHIVLTSFMVEMTEMLCAKHSTGSLFRDERDLPMTARQLADKLQIVVRNAGIGRTITPYYFRHSFTYNLLMKDMTSDKVASLLGHTSNRYVNKNYGHLKQRVIGLQGDLDALMGDGAA
jgi:site-specific recombinase XerD